MSITIEQSMCDHSFDENFFCMKCHYIDLNKHMLSKITFESLNLNFNKFHFDYISDLHLEFWCKDVNIQSPKLKKQIETFINDVLKPKTKNVLVIAGDLGHYPNQVKYLLSELKKIYKHIIFVSGNHDMYLISNRLASKYNNNSYNRILEMKQFCRDNENIHYLDGNIINIDGINFGGTGMWHDNSYVDVLEIHRDEIHSYWQKNMTDAKDIYFGHNYKQYGAYGHVVNVSSFDPMRWFAREQKRLDQIEACDVLITHYGPIVPETIPDKYKDDPYTCFYYFDGKKDIDRIKPKIWVHGHSHGYYEHEYNDCRIYCNTIGYPSENSYNEIKTLEI